MRALCRTAANDPQETYSVALLDHFVSHVEDSQWDRGIELLGGLELMMKEHLVALSASLRRFREGGGAAIFWMKTRGGWSEPPSLPRIFVFLSGKYTVRGLLGGEDSAYAYHVLRTRRCYSL